MFVWFWMIVSCPFVLSSCVAASVNDIVFFGISVMFLVNQLISNLLALLAR